MKTRIEKFKIEELTQSEMVQINGGGIFKKLGRLAHQAYCSIVEYTGDASNGYWGHLYND